MANGDQQALADFYDATHRKVFGLARRLLVDVSLAEEVVHDVYMQAWRTAASYASGRGTPLAWLMIITRSRSLDRLRSVSTRRRVERPLDEAGGTACEAAGPSHASISSERSSRLHRALAELPPPQRRAIELAYLSGLSHSEIARRLDEPLGTIKTRIRLAMRRLQSELLPFLEAS